MSSVALVLSLAWCASGGLLQEQAGALHAMGMLDYCALKGRILVTTAALVAAGSSLCYRCARGPPLSHHLTVPHLSWCGVSLQHCALIGKAGLNRKQSVLGSSVSR